MKKLLVLAAVLAFGVSVYAYGPGYGMGYGMGQQPAYQGNFGPGNCPGYGNFNQGFRGMKGFKGKRGQFNVPTKQYTKDEAKTEIQKFITDNFKGYTLKSVEGFNMPRGTVYIAKVTDSSGNNFQVRLNPFGKIVGPFLDK